MHALDHNATLAQIVIEHPAAARIFQRHGMDYCCHGDVSVTAACERASLDPEALFAELEAVLAASDAKSDEDPRVLSTAALVARIVDRHHGYLRRALPYIAPIASKVARVHGSRDVRLVELAAAFDALAASLAPHLDEEEEVLFPALIVRAPDAGLVAREMGRMREEHLVVGEILGRIRELSDAFATPEWGCNTYRVLMAELEALEADILRHVHLENHVLAPRFAALPGLARSAAQPEATT
jgi:regulator of cell morphogenesis and NO signaling